MRFVITLLLIFSFLALSAQIFKVNTSDQTYDFNLENIIKITFAGDVLQVQTELDEHNFPLSDIINLTFSESSSAAQEILPLPFLLNQNQPNPFNPDTRISFSITEAAEVKLEVYNLKGSKIAILVNNILAEGDHSYIWNGMDSRGNQAASGIYLYRLVVNNSTKTRKMMLLK